MKRRVSKEEDRAEELIDRESRGRIFHRGIIHDEVLKFAYIPGRAYVSFMNATDRRFATGSLFDRAKNQRGGRADVFE